MSNSLTVFPAALSDSEAQINTDQQLMVAKVGVPYSAETYEFLIRKSLQKSIDGLLEAGALLAVARACAPPGEWQRILDQIGLSRSYAFKLIDVHEKHQSLSKEGQKRLAALKPSVIFECVAALSDEQFEELVEEGETSGLKHEDLLKMSFRKAREALRKSEEEKESLKLDLEASRDLARKKGELNERLQAENDRLKRKRERATPNEQIIDLQNSLNVLKQEVEYLLNAPPKDPPTNSLLAIGTELLDLGNAHGLDQSHYLAGIVCELMTKLKVVRDELNLPILDEKTFLDAGEVR